MCQGANAVTATLVGAMRTGGGRKRVYLGETETDIGKGVACCCM